MRKIWALPLIAVAAGSIAACGGSSSSTTAPAGPPASSSGAAAKSSATSAGSTAARPVDVTTKHSKFGTILAVGPKQLTVYLFEADKGPKSSCAGPCASAWPPVLGKPKAAGAAVASDLGTIIRPDGRTQVTYNGHPLYTFVKDRDGGDAYGQAVKAFGADWYVLSPAGAKVDAS